MSFIIFQVATPTFSLTGSSTVEIGSSEIFAVDMHLFLGSGQLIFDAFSPINGDGDIYVCSAKVVSVGADFSCLNDIGNDTIVPVCTASSVHPYNERCRLDLGVVTSSGQCKGSSAV